MGVDLLQGSDLEVRNGCVIIRTTEGTAPVDVIYRRIDDEFLDPLSFNPDSLLGTPGLFDAYRSGAVMLANAPGAGIADDKAIYSYMPEIIEFYMGEKPLLDNIPTWRCSEPNNLAYVLAHLSELVVKEVHGSGGYGMLVGPAASKRELAAFTQAQGQPSELCCTTHLIAVNSANPDKKRPCTATCRSSPFCSGFAHEIRVTPGGLTRVALRKGSLVVNSSQGGAPRTHGFWSHRMLGRHADNLFWMARHLERTENSARRIQSAFFHTLTRRSDGDEEWAAILRSTGKSEAFAKRHESVSMANAIDYMLRDKANEDSIISLLANARQNARSVRTALTQEVWHL